MVTHDRHRPGHVLGPGPGPLALDVVVGKAEGLLYVERISFPDGQRWIHLTGYPQPFPVDPDELVQVLVPIPERDAQRLSVEQLGAVVVGRRMGGAA